MNQLIYRTHFDDSTHRWGLWLLMSLALIPHLLAQLGFFMMAQLSAIIIYPLTMGPFSILQTSMVVNVLGFTTHMAWLFAMLLALIWGGILGALWHWKVQVAIAIGLISFILTAWWVGLQLIGITI